MNDEIKEILELFGSADENIMFGDIVELNSKQSHLLLDYITNLQTIEQQYSALLSENAELENKITNLEEENEMYAQLKDEYEDIIDKAIKYIDNIGFLDWEDKLQDILLSGKKMKKILEGSDKE